MESMVIQLMGREYQVSVAPDEVDTLQQAVAVVSEKLQQLSGKVTSGNESLAVMAALYIAHDAIVAQRRNHLDLPASKGRIKAVNDRLEQVLGQQEKLF